MKYTIYTFLFFIVHTQALLSAEVGPRVELLDRDWEHGVREACREVSSVITTTINSRRMYMDYLQTPEAIIEMQARASEREFSALRLKSDIDVFIGRLKEITEHSKDLAVQLTSLVDGESKEENIHALLNNCMWNHFNTSLSINLFLYEVSQLLDVYPEVEKIYKAELNILETVFHVMLPLASISYQADFHIYKPVCVAKGYLFEVASDEVETFVKDSSFEQKLVVRKDSLTIITLSGAKVHLPFLASHNLQFRKEVKDIDMVTKAGTVFHCLYCKFSSGFEIQLYRLSKAEVSNILQYYTLGNLIFKAQFIQKELELAAKKERFKKRSATSTSTASTDSSADTILTPEAIDLFGYKDFMQKSKKFEKLKKTSVKKACNAGAGLDNVEDLKIETYKSEHLEKSKTPTDSVDVLSQRAIHKEISLRLLSKREAKPGVSLERGLSTRVGLSKAQKNVLLMLLRRSLSDSAMSKPIHTVKWRDLVSLLEGLGFHYVKGDVFINSAKFRLHIHAIHYDNNRINEKLMDILWAQLEYYGLSKEALGKMVD